MSLSPSRLKAAMKAAILSALNAWASLPSDHRNIALSRDAWAEGLADAISTTVISEFTGNAKVSGTDSRGDTLVTAGTSIS